MVIHAQRNQSQDGSNTAGHEGQGMVGEVPQRNGSGDIGMGAMSNGQNDGVSSSPELAEKCVHGERGSMLYTTARKRKLPLASELVDRVREVTPT